MIETMIERILDRINRALIYFACTQVAISAILPLALDSNVDVDIALASFFRYYDTSSLRAGSNLTCSNARRPFKPSI